MASGSSGNFQSIPALKPDQVPVPTTRGSVNMYMNLDDNLNIWTVDTFKVHRPVGSGGGSDIWFTPVGMSADFGPVTFPQFGAFFLSGSATTEADRTYEYKGGKSVKLNRLSIRVIYNTTPGIGNLIFTVRTGATLGTMTDTSIIVTIPMSTASNQTITNILDSVSINDGDFVSVKIDTDTPGEPSSGTIDLSVRIIAT